MKLASAIATGFMRARLNLTAVFSTEVAAKMALQLFFTPFSRLPRQTPDIFRKSEQLWLTSGARKVQIYRWNHPSPKKLLILHGFGSCAYKFDGYVVPMMRKGYEVIAMDAPAHGKSEGRRVTLTEYMQAIADLEGTYGPVDACLAHSFGGLAVSLYLENSCRAHRIKLALVAPATETHRAIESFFRFMQLNESVRTAFEGLIREKTGRNPNDYSISRVAGALPADILWAHDEDDELTPIQDVKPIMEAGHPHIQFVITKGLGHRRIYRDNAVKRLVISFLSGDRDFLE